MVRAVRRRELNLLQDALGQIHDFAGINVRRAGVIRSDDQPIGSEFRARRDLRLCAFTALLKGGRAGRCAVLRRGLGVRFQAIQTFRPLARFLRVGKLVNVRFADLTANHPTASDEEPQGTGVISEWATIRPELVQNVTKQ